MRKRPLSERQLLDRATRLARLKKVDFGLEYYSQSRCWCAIHTSLDSDGGGWSECVGKHRTRRAAVVELVRWLEAQSS